MGEIYHARDTRRELDVALKRVTLDLRGSPVERERRLHEACVRMEREAVHASRLGHPGIVNVSDLVYDLDQTPVLVMELLQGVTLQEHLTWSVLPVHVAIEWVAQVLDALSVAHAAGVIHRDLKPDNLFLVHDASMPHGVRVKLLDFGVAKQVEHDTTDDDDTALTSVNVFMGSYQYAAPEQFDTARALSTRTDLYAVGVILFKALTGEHPAGTRSLNDLMLRTLFGNIERSVRAHRSEVPEWLDGLIQQALARDPDARPTSAEAMRDVLVAHRTSRAPAVAKAGQAPQRDAPSSAFDGRTWVIAALAVIAVAGWLAWAATRFGW
jgi:serine/threonine-protein kinase